MARSDVEGGLVTSRSASAAEIDDAHLRQQVALMVFHEFFFQKKTDFLKVVTTLESKLALRSAAFGGWHFQYKSTTKRETEKIRRTRKMKVKVRTPLPSESSRKKSSVATRMRIWRK